jgi:hypothetical protein
MKARNTAIMLLVLGVLAALVYYGEYLPSQNVTPTPAPSATIKVLDLNPEDIIGLQVSSAFSRTVTRFDNGAWHMDEPTKEEADTMRLNNLVNQFAKLNATRALTETPTNLAPFGLVTGTLTITLRLKDNRLETIRFGDMPLQGGVYYAQRAGDARVYLLTALTYSGAEQLLTTLPKKPTPTPTAPPPLPTNTPAPTPLLTPTTATPEATPTPKP